MLRLVQIVILCCAMAFHAIAHNAKIATYTLRDTGMGWFIEMNFAQAAIDAQMLKLFDKQTLESMSQEAYKSAFIKYLNDHFILRVDGEKVKLIRGGILLGSHQTDVKYVLPEIPTQPQDISIYLPMFEDIYNQTNLFRIYRGGEKFTKFFLSTDNNFSAHMEFREDGIYAVDKAPYNMLATISGVVVLILIAMGVVILARRQLKNTQLRKA